MQRTSAGGHSGPEPRDISRAQESVPQRGGLGAGGGLHAEVASGPHNSERHRCHRDRVGGPAESGQAGRANGQGVARCLR